MTEGQSMVVRYALAIVAALCSARPICCIEAPAEADLILHHGKIVTVDRRFSIHEAMAIRGGRILRVGTDASVMRTGGPHTRIIVLGGKLVLPGLMDSHTHPAGASMTEF